MPFLVRAVQIYAAANLPQAQFLAPDAALFRSFLADAPLKALAPDRIKLP